MAWRKLTDFTDEIELDISDFSVDFSTVDEDRLRYLQWLLAHNICGLAFNNPYIKQE